MPLKPAGLWRHPDFVKLWAGQTVSVFGTLIGWTAIQLTAILWLRASAAQVSVLAACQLVSGFGMGLVAGVWVDRLRRRPVLIAADTGRAVLLGTVPLAAFFDVLRMEQLYVVAFLTSALTVFFDVAYEAHLPTLVSTEELIEGNSKLTASASVAEFTGFGLSGWLVQWLTAPAAVLVDALSFLWSAAFISRIRTPEPQPAPPEERGSIWREARAGMRVVLHAPILRSLAGASLIVKFFERIIGVAIMLYLVDEVGWSVGVLGMAFGVGGVTSLCGALLAGRVRGRRLGLSLVLAAGIRASGAIFTPLVADVSLLGLAFLVAAQLVTDPAATFYEINEVSLRQAITAERLRGRVNATMRVLDFGAALAGTLFGGLVAEAFGLRTALWVASSGVFGAALWLLCSPVFRLHQTPAGPMGTMAAEEAVLG